MSSSSFVANHANSEQVQPRSGPADGCLCERHREGLQGVQRGWAHLHINGWPMVHTSLPSSTLLLLNPLSCLSPPLKQPSEHITVYRCSLAPFTHTCSNTVACLVVISWSLCCHYISATLFKYCPVLVFCLRLQTENPPAVIQVFIIQLYGSHVLSSVFVIAESMCDPPVAVVSVDSTTDALFLGGGLL